MKKVAINVKHGGFRLSEAAYTKLIEWGVPVRGYKQPKRDPETGLYKELLENKGEVIFDHELDEPDELMSAMARLGGRYWETWTDGSREHPLVIRVIEELGEKANGRFADLKIVEIPDDVEYEIAEYDGLEWVAEAHRTWS